MFTKDYRHVTPYGVINLPGWWPLTRCFAFGFVFLTPHRVRTSSRNHLDSVVAHEAEHVKRQRRLLVIPWLIMWAVSKAFRFDEEARGFAAAGRWARDKQWASDEWMLDWATRKGRALSTSYWLGPEYTPDRCQAQIEMYLFNPSL